MKSIKIILGTLENKYDESNMRYYEEGYNGVKEIDTYLDGDRVLIKFDDKTKVIFSGCKYILTTKGK